MIGQPHRMHENEVNLTWPIMIAILVWDHIILALKIVRSDRFPFGDHGGNRRSGLCD